MSDTITVRVTPGASHDRVVREGEVIRVYVTAPPADGKANKAVLKLLAKELGVPKSSLAVIRGLTSRDKVVQRLP